MTNAPTRAFIINLPNNPKRWKSAVTQANRGGWTDIQRIEGVDGMRLTMKQREQSASGFCSLFCTAGQLGAALAHMKAWRTLLESDSPSVVVFEDDVVLREGARTLLEDEWEKVPRDFDILMLGCVLGCYRRPPSKAEIVFTMVGGIRTAVWARSTPTIVNDKIHVPTCVRGLQGYVLSRKGAIKLLRALTGKIAGHIDIALDTIPGLRVYSWHPELAFQVNKASISNIASSGSPKLLTTLGDKVYLQDNLTLSYGITCPIWGIDNRYHVNAMTAIWFNVGILFALWTFLFSRSATKSVTLFLIALVCVIYSLDIAYEPFAWKTWYNVFVSLLLVLLPAALVRTLVWPR